MTDEQSEICDLRVKLMAAKECEARMRDALEKIVSHPIQFRPIDVVSSYQLEIKRLKADVERLESLLRDSVDVRREALRWAFRQFMELSSPKREITFIKRGLKELE